MGSPAPRHGLAPPGTAAPRAVAAAANRRGPRLAPPPMPATRRPAAPPPPARPAAAQLAMAFDGNLPPVRTTLAYRLSTLAVLAVLLLLPACYVAMIAAAGVAWYAVHATAMFSAAGTRATAGGGRLGLALLVAYVAPLIAGGLLVALMVLPLFRRRRRNRPRPVWVDRREQPLLYAYVDKLCDTMRVPRPVRIDLVPTPNASAHIDNGLFGLVNRRLVLTIGLPLAASLDLRQFTAVIAHEFGHFAQGGAMRASYAVHRINGWFFRLAYRRTVADDLVASLVGMGEHWATGLVAVTARATLSVARLAMKGLAVVSRATSMHLSRHAEFDADRRSARIVGADALADALQATPFLAAAGDLAAKRARAGWARRQLPDDLIALTHGLAAALPPELRAKIEADVLARDARWFDTHPPLFQRVAALKRAGPPGVLRIDAPATCLLRDFDELCKMATTRFYQGVFGDQLRPEHIVPTDVPAGMAR